MKKITFFLAVFFLVASTAIAQDYLTRNGRISFHSSTPVEDIDAVNNEVVSTLNTATGQFEFRVAILGFRFDIVDMQKHFNGDTYMNSAKYPRASFSGKIADLSKVDFTKDGTYPVTVQGNLTIKDVTKPVTATGNVIVKGGKITAQSEFKVKRAEYNVTGEAIHEKKIGQVITIRVDCTYDKR